MCIRDRVSTQSTWGYNCLQINKLRNNLIKMVKKSAQDPVDTTLQQQIRTYLITARRLPSEKDKNPKVIQMRVFAKNDVAARTKFWYQMRQLNKLRKIDGEILSINEIYEKNPCTVKTYGIVLKYQSRTYYHNMYKEYRDCTLNGAISQLFRDMAGNHRADPNTIHIIRTMIVVKRKDVRRPLSQLMRDSKLKFPIVKSLPRSSDKQYRTIFKSKRPNLYKA
eukprot:TRINITY_DN4692_c0_g1_i5.p1 TRINITY_DN4692_c0_g1~~TRINITY_DN4692_c0_g1_i5.p1  ORF type:complete len:222 (-),score=47.50 TRINITY_DN4692_c0_g1_i5:138-803(-)